MVIFCYFMGYYKFSGHFFVIPVDFWAIFNGWEVKKSLKIIAKSNFCGKNN